jgi:hypothetical protein
MALIIRQSTAVTVVLGPFVDSTDGVTAETGLTISQADVRLSKNGGAFAQANDANAAAHMENGYYSKALSTTDSNTVGTLVVAVNESGALPVWMAFQVVEEAVYDMFFAASAIGYIANQPVDLNTIKTQTVTCAGGVTVPAATLASTTNITAGTITTVTNLTNAPTAGDFTATMKTSIGTAVAASAVASVTGNVGGNVSGSVGSVVGAVGSVTGAVGSVTGSIGSLGAQAKLDVNAEADTAISDAALATASAVADLPTNAELSTALGTADDAVLAAIAALNNISAAQVNAEVDTAISDAFTFSNGNVNSNVEEINTVTITGDGQVGTEFGVT